jgi:dimethylallyltranstransferase
MVLLNHGVSGRRLLEFSKIEGQSDFISYFRQHDVLGILIGGFTVFSFLMWLRIADDFKDYELDCRLFATRPLPSGRVHKKDLRIFAAVLIGVTLLINILFMKKLYLLSDTLYLRKSYGGVVFPKA